jgi:hypothetical protein
LHAFEKLRMFIEVILDYAAAKVQLMFKNRIVWQTLNSQNGDLSHPSINPSPL